MAETFDFNDHSHRRFNPLTESWVLCSPHRAKRPWSGQQEDIDNQTLLNYDPGCYLCPGNKRVNGEWNPQYTTTFMFQNDFQAVKPNQPTFDNSNDGTQTSQLFRMKSVRGECHVICFSPNHDKTIADMTIDEIIPVINAWKDIYITLSKIETIHYIQIFENKGAIMGCSNPHPHGQVWALEDIPMEPFQELQSMMKYHQQNHGECLLCNYAKMEMDYHTNANKYVGSSEAWKASRLVCHNDSFLVVVPFWAVWPFETLVLAKSHLSNLTQFDPKTIQDLAMIIRELTCKYDNLFKTSFPYSMGIHQTPTLNYEHPSIAHFHMHFLPPLLRSATIKKFQVGFELLGEPQRDITPESAALKLRDLSSVHYKLLNSNLE